VVSKVGSAEEISMDGEKKGREEDTRARRKMSGE
jgi:hypothetical protein